jgi:hypothetical protein
MIGVSSPGRGWEFFSSTPWPDRLWNPPQPSIKWVPRALTLGVKWPGREADHSPPSSAEVKNAWSYTSTPNTLSWRSVQLKHRDNFTLCYVMLRSSVSELVYGNSNGI